MAARRKFVLAVLGTVLLAVPPGSSLASATDTRPSPVAGLEGPVRVVRDTLGIPHVFAQSDHDAYFMVGYLHAQDRLFQMDQTRRQASGTLAELLGPGALASDVQFRTLGLTRAAARSLAALSPTAVAVLRAYSEGVNAYVSTHALPPEYAALELTTFQPWTPLDTVAVTKLLAFGLSFDLDDIANTQNLIAYQTALGPVAGTLLFREDVMRSEPFAHSPTIEPGETSNPIVGHGQPVWSSSFLSSATLEQAADVLAKAKAASLGASTDETGSNVFAVSGSVSESGRPMVANDPHLSLASPSTFYEIGLDAKDLVLYGVTFPGTPLVVHGMNQHIAWGSTVDPTDVTDVYQEQVVLADGVPVATMKGATPVPTTIIPIQFRANQPGNAIADDLVTIAPPAVPAAAVETRHGPLISLSGTTGLSVQHTGFYATREPDYFLELARAKNVGDAERALRYFDFGAQNWMVADDSGNIAYFTNREVPLREDLQAGTVAGLPPYFIRNGVAGNDWIPQEIRPEDHAIPFAKLPDGELERLVNPADGVMSNANQDPTGQTFDNDPLNELRPGGGIRYTSPGYEDGNRNARISERLEEALADGKISFAELQSIQADVKLHDAAVLVPAISATIDAAQTPGAPPPLASLGADPAIQEAVARLEAWDFSTPTGIAAGYDAFDVDGVRSPPSQTEIDASVAATIYSLWRGQALAQFVDGPMAAVGLGGFLPGGAQAMTALRRLIGNPNSGASGIFVASTTERDTLVLTALKDALALAASPAFAPAFGGSTDEDGYRWGKLHRITFMHPLGGAFAIPPGAGFADVGPGLPGIGTDGGFSVVDASSHDPRASTLNGFRFSSGPARRFVAEADRSQPTAVQVTPGGASGNPLGPWFGNQLGLWLTDDYHQATIQVGEIERDAAVSERFTPAN